MKHLKLFEDHNNSDSIFIEFDDNKYNIIWDEDIIPDTEYGVYQDENYKKYLVLKSNVDKLKALQEFDRYYDFNGIAVTWDYYNKAEEVLSKYDEVKADADSIRSSDDQYEDPSEWSARDEYNKYYKDGNWSDNYWDYCL